MNLEQKFQEWRAKYNYPNRDDSLKIVLQFNKNININKMDVYIKDKNYTIKKEEWFKDIGSKFIRDFFKNGKNTVKKPLKDIVIDDYIGQEFFHPLYDGFCVKAIYNNNKKIILYVKYKHNDKFIESKDQNYSKQLLLECINYEVYQVSKELDKTLIDKQEIIEQSVKIAREKQKHLDTNRIERKTFREHSRIYNALSELNKSLINELKNHNLKELCSFQDLKPNKNTKHVGIIHISDTHFNELIDVSGNKYDFNIASKRLKKFADEAIKIFNVYNINTVLIAMTGDLLNSDRRLDELLNMATNRAKASLLSVSLLSNFILYIRKQGFSLKVACTSGNESRMDKDWHWSENIITDNYDFLIFNMLKMVTKDCEIEFIKGDSFELVVKLGNQNILLTHGNQFGTNIEKQIQGIKGKYASKNIIINYVLFGHLHSARVGDCYARSSSLCGSNDYSDKALQLEGRASQNLFTIDEYGNNNGFKIDLQNVNHIEGFDIQKELEEYDAKSLSKTRKNKVII